MQNVVHNSNCDSTKDNEINEAATVHSGSSSPLSGNISVERGPSVASLQAHFMAELSESDDDDVSEVESFILEQAELDEEPGLDTSKFLLADDSSDNCIDVETQCRLEALLEASGNFFENGQLDSASTSYAGIGKLALAEGKQYSNQEVLRRLTSSVSCALDEAAAALSRMRSEPHPSDQGDCRSLAEACSDGDIIAVKKLLEQGRNVNEMSEEGESLLSLACSSGYYELAQLLLAMKANVEDRGLKDTTPLMEAASAGHMDIIKMLIHHGADVNAQTSQEKKLKSVKVKNTQDLNSLKPQQSQQELHSGGGGTLPAIVCPEGNTPLMFACAAGHESVVRLLLDAGARVEDHNENGHTPLMEAASAGHVQVARLLVERGASINTHSNEFKESALTLACYKGHLEMVRFLLEAGADREHKTDEMHTALMEASMDGHVEVARLLLDSGAQVNMPADSFESPLTLAACGGHVELAMLLLERGANIEEVNDEGYTPLMEAAREGHEEMVALLLSQGADINAQTEETQETALTLACCGGFLEVADFLIKAGADYEIGASTPLMEAAQEGHLELVKYLINAGANVNATTATGDSALTYACENGHTDVADLLLQACAKLEHESEGGRTPLMKAARAGHLCTVQFLISKGANVNKQTTNNDHNPLSLACAGGHINIVELLLGHGADPTHKLKDNSTMLIEASKGGHTAVVQLLLDYPNNLLATPPPPPDVSQMTNATLEASEAPRVPPHGLQVFPPHDAEQNCNTSSSYLANVQSVPRIQELLQVRDNLPGASPQAVPKQKSQQRKNVLVGKNNEVPPSSSYATDNVPRYHYRSKSNAAAQVNSLSIQAETRCLAGEGGGGNLEAELEKELKPSERLEACINSMMKKAEMLHPSPEEQILQKQQILEELQRVERELQEKAQAQLLLTAQHHHHNQHQGLATVVTGTPTITTFTSNTGATFPPPQQLLINNGSGGAVLDMESLADMASMSGHLGLNLRATASNLMSPASFQPHYQHPKPGQPSVITTTTASAASSEYCKSRVGKQVVKQAKTTSTAAALKQHQQFQLQHNQLQNAIKIQSQGHLEEIEKLNLRNAVLSEQQQMQFQQQLLHQQQHTSQQQEQLVLSSEFTQNLTLRSSDYCAGAIDGLMHAVGGGIKLTTTDASQAAHTIPMFDPVTVGQALLQQQLQQQQQQLQHQQLTQAIQQENKRQQQHFEKNVKVLKGKTNKVQQQSLLHASSQSSMAAAFQAQQSQVIKQQLSTGCGEACTMVGNIPLEATGVLTLSGVASPAFPVSLAVSPGSLQSPVSISTSCGASFTQNIALEDGLMVAAPARSLHETLGDIITGPTTQLAGTQMNLVQQGAHCSESCLGIASGKSRSLSMSSLPNPTPLTFHTVTPCVPVQVPIANDHLSTSPSTPAPPMYPPLDLNSQTDSNHDTALTLACAGGHEELVSLLLSRGADIEHRDKKGFTPLMLAATAGHGGVVDILLNHASDIEAQSERTKDTALSLACSGGRYEVVDILLARGANKEHRNVSDYTPLSLAASGGYVNIIKLLLSHGAEINSRTGSKLGISPLMLAAMNGHTQAVKLLLDMGSDINAQIETNRNTALTLACFQGRHEVVSLLLDRKANVEHRAKTGLTPLMEAASGGYVEVGKVLIDKGADVNAPPVPSSRDTALTIAADKGHYRFVQLLLEREATVDVKNKKGNSPLWLAANGGHLEVVQLLCASSADIDSQDNRKVSCLMAAFRKGHVKVVKWMVKYVSQFPSDQEMARYMSTITDKELLKKCSQCVDTIRIAKERQAAEANKNANILLEELDLERCREESRKAAAARRRERKRKKKREKQEQMRAAKAAAEESKKYEKDCDGSKQPHSSQSEAEEDEDEDDDDDDDDEDDEEEEEEKEEEAVFETKCNPAIPLRLPATNTSPCKSKSSPAIVSNPLNDISRSSKIKESIPDTVNVSQTYLQKSITEPSRSDKRRDREKVKTQEKNKRNMTKSAVVETSKSAQEINVVEKHVPKVPETVSNPASNRSNKKQRNQKHDVTINCTVVTTSSVTNLKNVTSVATMATDLKVHSVIHKHYKQPKEILVNGVAGNSVSDYDDLCALFAHSASMRGKGKTSIDSKLGLDTFGDLSLDLPSEVVALSGLRSPSAPSLSHSLKGSGSSASPKKWQKRDEGWKEVVRSKLFNRSKKVSVPANAISRVIGRGGCNINAIREGSGAHIEVEKQKGQGDRTVIIRGSAESTRLAQQLITGLIKEPDKELSEILSRCGLGGRTVSSTTSCTDTFRAAAPNNPSLTTTAQVSTISSQSKSSSRQSVLTKSSGNAATSVIKTTSIPPPSLPANAMPPFTNQIRSVVTNTQNIRPGIPTCSATPPFLNSAQNAWTGVVMTGKVPSNVPRPTIPICTASAALNVTTMASRVVTTTTVEKSPVVRQLFPQGKKDTSLQPGSTTATKTTVSYTMAVIAQGKSAAKTDPSSIITVTTKVTATTDTKVSTISPISMERSGSAPPSSAVIQTQISVGHSTCTGPSSVQPFTMNNHSPKISNGPVVPQQETSAVNQIPARMHSSPVPAQSKPFGTISMQPPTSVQPVAEPSSTSPPAMMHMVANVPSAIAQEYSPFNNLFCKVAQSVWGQKDNRDSKPNFASVAAVGVTSVATQIQNCNNTVQSTLTLAMPPQNIADHELIVDAAKAPGYRGNFHISPSASSTSSVSSNPTQASSFGPIGSGPRSAPCTPPLGPIGPPSSAPSNMRRSTPPVASPPSPSPPPPTSRPLSDSQHNMLSELQQQQQQQQSRSMAPQISEALFHHHHPAVGMHHHTRSLQSFPMASPGTNTTFSQHSPLSSVVPPPESTANSSLQQVVQSNLNPNAPDFSSRAASLLMAPQTLHHMQPRLPNSFQENPHLAQFRPILASGGFPLHALPTPHPQAMNRFPFHHQQQDFNSSGSLQPPPPGSMSQGGTDALPLLSMMAGYPSQVVPPGGSGPHHYPGMQSVVGIRPNQRSASTTPSVGTSSKDEGSPMAPMSPNSSPQGSNLPSPTGGGMGNAENSNPAGTIGEDRKLPRPIGMERAQRKNPMFGGVSDVGGIWSFSSSGRSAEMAATGDWMHTIPGGVPQMQQEDTPTLQPAMHNNYNRFADMLALENNHTLEQSYQQAVSGGNYPFVNGLPPQLVAPHLFQQGGGVEAEMWHHPKLSATGEPPQQQQQHTLEHKMQTWQNWSPHQT